MRIAYRREIGDDLAEGIARAAQKWGRWDEDTSSAAVMVWLSVRSAMSAALSRLREEGLISYRRSRFWLTGK